jgi:thiamine transport system permease protein
MRPRLAIFAVVLIFLALFYCYPLASIFLQSLVPEGRWDLTRLERLFTSPTYLRILWFTTWQALLSTLLTLLLALPGAYVFTRYRFFGKGLWQALLTVPFVLPTVVAAAAFQAMLGPSGLINSVLMSWLDLQQPPLVIDQGLGLLLLAHVFYNYSLVMRLVSSYWAGLDPNLRGAAASLGASPLQVFRRITLPLLMPAIAAAALLVFIFCFASFGIVLILGGPGNATIEVEIYRQAIHLFNLPMAAALSLVQLAINFLLMWLQARIGTRGQMAFFTDSGGEVAVKACTWRQRMMLGTNLALIAMLLLAPLAALLGSSFFGEDGLTLAYYQKLFDGGGDSIFFVQPATAIGNSLLFALTTMITAVLLGLGASLYLAQDNTPAASWWDALIMLPLATSAVSLGFGFIITFNHPPLDLRDTLTLIVIAHTLVAFPFVVRCILPALRRISPSLREAASILGASPARVFFGVEVPLIARSILVGAIFAFAISMGEFGASAFVTRPQTATIPVAIFRFLGYPGELNFGQAMAMSSLLLLFTCAALLLLAQTGKQRQGNKR